jgi:aerobic carbon-monoxide dehydrogenase medium subunit
VRCSIGLFGLGPTPARAAEAERSVVGAAVTEIAAEDLGLLAMRGLDGVPSDLHGSAQYRRRVGAAMVSRAWTSAAAEARRG